MDKEETESFCESSGTAILGATIKTPLGLYRVKACGQGTHSILRTKTAKESFKPDLRVDVLESNTDMLAEMKLQGDEGKSIGKKDPQVMIQNIVEWFHCYFNDPLTLQKNFSNSVEVCTKSGTPFQQEIWRVLQEKVEFGSTVSYGELAALANKANAARAVGTAMRLNPNCLIVPCHRVVRANSEIGNYNGGSEIKEWLLNHEKNNSGKK